MNAHNFNFSDSVREDTSLIIAIAGASGSGKTTTSLRLAVGLAGGEPIAFIDSEAGRARHYFPTPNDKRSQEELLKERLFRVRYLDMPPPYSPQAIWEAIDAAVTKEKAAVVVFDNFSDSWEGVGGLHDMHNEEIARLARKPLADLQEWELSKYNFPAWNVPKSKYKNDLMKKLKQVRAHVIFCLRAEEKTTAVQTTENGRTKTAIVNAGWTPIAEKKLMYEMAISFTVTPDAPGVPLMRNGEAVYGKLNPPYLQFFPEGKQVTEAVGANLRAWARGEQSPSQKRPVADQQVETGADQSTSQASAPAHDSALLWEYHAQLAATGNKDAMVAVHTKMKPKFKSAATLASAEKVFTAHRERLNGLADAAATATYVSTVIDG